LKPDIVFKWGRDARYNLRRMKKYAGPEGVLWPQSHEH
jgi:hypothetical protein